ncbi:GNAT family N-acetyltransferase [Paenibacillus durus]|uniref:GNAT family N-acetyltransferase n=1 Tax=Paenibacillus durus TaxID=44251 RepID=UPI0004B4199C|nr:GNAT family N-acetyltransferase [Paenibacillus durus]
MNPCGYIAGIFVSNEAQSKGIGTKLLETIKERYSELSLTVYKKNMKAVNFYQRELFVIKQEQIDKNTEEAEYLMVFINTGRLIFVQNLIKRLVVLFLLYYAYHSKKVNGIMN